jgi:glycosyltransferase involved in cell wall biosynthesis
VPKQTKEHERSGSDMKILFLAPVPPPVHGGIINWTRLVKTEFAKRPDYELCFVDSTPRYRDLTNFSVLQRIISGSAKAVRDSLRVFYQFRTFCPDIFHLCTSGGPATIKDAILVTLSRRLNIPVVIHYHMGRLPQILTSKTMESRLILYILKASSAVLVLGTASEKAVRKVVPDQYVVNLPNMVDMDEIDAARIVASPQGEIKKPWIITFVGHVVPLKGIKELVMACAALRGGNLELHLVGPCSESFRDVLVNAAYEGKTDDWCLKFSGPVNHAEALRHIARCDLFVLPSYTEGAPNVILEAMGMGKPILSTFVGAIPEMLAVDTAAPCGVCVKPGCRDSIQKAIQNFLDKPLKWNEFASNARCRAESTYSAPVACAQLKDVWQDFSLR